MSAEYGEFTYTVVYINRSPVIVQPEHSLPDIREDVQPEDNTGIAVGTLSSAIATDSDDTYLGLVVIHSDQTNGVWEYSEDYDSDFWSAFPTDAVLALRNDSLVRFVPNQDFFGRSYFTVRAWDETNEPEEVIADFMAASLSSPYSGPYSSGNSSLLIDVTRVNDPPQVTLGVDRIEYTENAPPVQIFQGDLDISDVDSTTISSAVIRLECPDCSGAVSDSRDGQVSSGMSLNSQFSNDMIIALHAPSTFIISPGPSNELMTELFILPVPGLADNSLDAFEDFLQTLHFMNTDREPSGASRRVTLIVNDGSADSSSVSLEIAIELVNDEPPVVILAADTLVYREDSGFVPVFSVIPTITDLDDNSVFPLESAVIELVGPGVRLENERLSVNCTSQPVLTCNYNNGHLFIRGNASVSVYEEILGSVMYTNDLEEPMNDPRRIVTIVSDGRHNSSDTVLNIQTLLINDQTPILDPEVSVVVFQEANPVSPPIRLAPDMTVSDGDSGMFPVHSVAVNLSGGENNNEGLSLQPGLVLPSFVSIAYDSYLITLSLAENPFDPVRNQTLTGIPLQVVQTFIRNVYYYNNAEEPEGVNRTVTFTVFDELTDDGVTPSIPATVSVLFEFVDDLPVVELNSLVVVYSEGQDPRRVTLAPGAVILDVDDTNILGLEITLTPSRDDIDISREVILVDIPEGSQVEESGSGTNSTIALTGEASLSAYRDILRTLSYEHTVVMGNPDPGNRIVSVTPISAGGRGVADELVIAFNATNNAPVLDLNGALPGRDYVTSFIEQTAPVYLTTRDLQLTDVDNEQLAYIDVVLSPTPDMEYEVILVNMSVSPELQDVRTAPSTLRLEGPAPVERFTAVLLTLQYINAADEPDPVLRTVTFTVSDGDQQTEQVTTVNIVLQNDAPNIFLNGTERGHSVEFVEEGSPVHLSTNPTVTDPDSLLIELRIQPVAEFANDRIESPHGFQFNQNLGVYFINFTGASSSEVEQVIQSITFSNNESEPHAYDRSYCFTVVDEQQLSSPEDCVSVRFVFINDNPPVFPEETFQTAVQENRNSAFVIQLTAVDEDVANTPTTLVYSIIAGDDCLPPVDEYLSSGSGLPDATETPLNPSLCRFSIDSLTGVVSTSDNPPDREERSEYTLLVSASDGELTGFAHLAITILDVNDNAPVFVPELYNSTIPLGAEADLTLAELVVIDPDIGEVTFIQLTMEPPAGRQAFSLDVFTGRVSLLIPADQLDLTISQYVLTFEALDQGFLTSTNQATLVVNVVHNIPPVFDQNSYTVALPENHPTGVSILGVRAEDPDEEGDIVYSLLSEGDSPFSINPGSGVISFTVSPDFEAIQSYQFEVRAADQRGGVGTATVQVQIENMNDFAPQFTQMMYRGSVCESSPVAFPILSVLATDGDAGSLGAISYEIFDQSNCTNCLYINSSTGEISVARQLDFEAYPSFYAHVRAIDGGNFSQTATVHIDVLNDNEHTPLFQFETIEETIPENYPIGNPLPLIARYFPLALDDDTCDVDQCDGSVVVSTVLCSGLSGLVYSIISGNEDGFFSIDQNSGAVSLTMMLDFDQGENINFTLGLSVSDGEFSSTATLIVMVTDFNDNLPNFTAPAYNASVFETVAIGTEVVQVSASDLDPTSQITYSIAGQSAEDFSIDPVSGIVTVASPLDFERRSEYNLIVVARDGQEATSTSPNTIAADLNIYVIDETDEVPVLLPPFVFEVPENSPPGPIGLIEAFNGNSDPDAVLLFSVNSDQFTVGHNGMINSTVSFDYEQTRELVITVTVVVDGAESLRDAQNYTITILDVNDNPPVPVQDQYTVQVNENMQIGFEVVTVEATDADSAENAQLQFVISSGNDLGHFAIDERSGVVRVSGQLDRETVDTYNLLVVVSDSLFSVSVGVLITVLDEPDNPPVFVQDSYTASVLESASPGLEILPSPVQATDADSGLNGEINYAFQSTPFDNPFTIDSLSGVVTLDRTVDRELTQQYDLVVVAFNPNFPNGTNASVGLTVTILDVNDNPPQFLNDVFSAQVNEDYTPVSMNVETLFSGSGDGLVRSVFTVSATDADEPNTPNSQIEYSLLTHTDVFTISPSGEISAISQLDREGVNFYRLVVQAADLGSPALSSTASVDISIIDVNDNVPQISEAVYYMEILEDINPQSEVLQVIATDFDTGSNSALFFTLVSSETLPFALDSLSGQVTTTAELDRETIPAYNFRVRVSDGGLPSLSAVADVQIVLVDVNDNPPEISPPSLSLLLEENHSLGPLGDLFNVSDADIGLNAVSDISLSGQSSSFSVDDSGVLHVNGSLDYETMPELMFVVVVRNVEPPFWTTTAQVNVQLINLNDNPPIVNFGAAQLEYVERSKQLVLNVGAFITDDDGLNVTTLVDGIVELIGTDPREPSEAFTPNTNDSPIDCPREDNKNTKFRACNIPVESGHFFTMPSGDILNERFTAADLTDDTIIFDRSRRQYVYSTISTSFVNTGMTISTWVWVDPVEGQTSPMAIISKSSPVRRLYSVYCTSDLSLGFQYIDSSNQEQSVLFENGCERLSNQWHHLALVLDNSNPDQSEVRVYIDASLFGSRSISPPQDSAGNVFVGTRTSGGVNTARGDYFNGRVHLTAISNTVARLSNINCFIGCGAAMISSLESTPLQFSYDFTRRALVIVGRQSPTVYEEFLNSLILVLPLFEPVSSTFSLSYTVQDDFFNCLPNFIDIVLRPTNDFVPTLTLNGQMLNYSTVFVEEQAPISVVNQTSLSLSDQDLVAFPYMVTVTILNPQPPDSDEVLAVSNVPNDMNMTYENYQLTLSGELPLPMFESVLRTITYVNRDDEPVGSHRQLLFALSDPPWDDQTAYSQVQIVLVNDLPVLSVSFGTTEYREGDGVVSVLQSVLIMDSDNITMVSAVISLNALDGEFEVIGVDTAGTSIDAQYDSSTNTISLSGEDSLGNYTSVIQSLTYEHTSDGDTTPGTRTIVLTVFDGLNSSMPVNALIFFSDVNDAPVIDLNGPAAGSNYQTVFTEGAGSVSITDQATLIDVDNITLVSLVITLSGIQDEALERLEVTTASGLVISGQQVVYPASGVASVSDMLSVVRSAQYINEAEEPTGGDRLVEFVASDGAASSTPVFTTVTVETANDPPFLDIDTENAGPGYQTSFTEEGEPVFITSRSVAIVDNDANATISNVLVVIHNAFDLLREQIESTDPNVTITPMTATQSRMFMIDPMDTSHDAVSQLLTTLVYRNSLSEPTGGIRNITISVSDGTVYSNAEPVTLDVVLINEDTPQFSQTTYSRSVVEESAAGTVIATVFAQDMDSGSDGMISYDIISSDPPQFIDSFTVNESGVVTTTRPLDRETADLYTLQVVARDGGSPSRQAIATLSVTVLDINDQVPQFAAGTDFSLSVMESRPTGYVIYTISAVDGDIGSNALLEFELADENSNLFDVLPNGEIVVNGPLDADIDNPVYQISVQVSDNGTVSLSSEAVFNISVTDVNDNSPQFVPGPVFSGSITENVASQMSILRVTAIDADSGENQVITFSIAALSFTDYFSIDPITGDLSSIVPLDREERETYTFSVLAVDGGTPARTANGTITVIVTDVNDNEPTFSSTNYSAQVFENEAPGTTVLQVVASDLDIGQNGDFRFSIVDAPTPMFSDNPYFTIDPMSGEILVSEPVDFELEPVITLEVRATDLGDPSLTGSATVSVLVVDQNDNPPRFSQQLYQASVPENEADHFVTSVFAGDADSGVNGEVRYSLLNWDGVFSIDSQSGEIRTVAELDFEANCFYRLLVFAEDSGGVRQNATALVDVLVSPVNDIPPVFSPPAYTRSISENMPPGAVVTQVFAVDRDETICSSADVTPSDIPIFSGLGPELGSGMEVEIPLMYSLLSHSDRFTIDSETGLITTLVTLDREEDPQYVLSVRVEDHGGLFANTTVTVNVMDQNDNAPMFLQPRYEAFVSESADIGTPVVQVQASDPDFIDQGRLVYSLSEPSQLFSINNQTGVVFVSGPLDVDAESVDTSVRLVAIVRDSGSFEAPALVDITITDINDVPPSINTSPQMLTFTEGDVRLLPFPQISITDTDSSQQLCSATVVLTTPGNMNTPGIECACTDTSDVSSCTGGCLEFVQLLPGSFSGNVTQSNSGTTLTLEGMRSIADYSSAIEQIEYINIISNPLPESREISLSVFDCQLPSNTLFQTISIQPLNVFPPVVDLNGPTEPGLNYVTRFVERGPAVFVTSSNATIADEDSFKEVEELTGLDLWITNPQDGSSEYVNLSPFSHPTISLTRQSPHYISFSGVGLLSDYVSIMVAITYSNDREEPSSVPRVISVVAHENHLSSEVVNTTVNFVTFNDHPPVIITSPPYENSVVTHREGNNATLITAANAFISDRDSVVDPILELQVYALVQRANDNIYLSSSVVLPDTITMEQPTNTQLVFSGTASVAEYNTILRSLRYQYTAEEFESIFPPLFVYLQVMDSMYSSFSIVQLQFDPVNDQQPVFSEEAYEALVPENATVGYSVMQVAAVDNDRFSPANIVYSIVGGNEDGFFRISSADGTIYLNRSVDFEMTPLHSLIVEVEDVNYAASAPAVLDTAVVSIMIGDENDHVPMFTMTEYNTTVAEGVPIGTPILQVTATDRDSELHSQLEFELTGTTDFQVDRETGVVSTAGEIDRLVTDSYTFFVTVRNPGVLPFDVARITITVLDLDNNPPVIALDPPTAILREPDTSIFLSPQMTVTDRDLDPSLDYALVEIVSRMNNTDVPGQLLSTVSVEGISLTGNGTQRLVFAGESRSLADYTQVLRGVVYQDLSDEPLGISRVARYQVGSNPSQQSVDFQPSPDEMTSEIVELMISVELLNDNPPELALDTRDQASVGLVHPPCQGLSGSYSANYVEDGDPVVLSHSSLTITDRDSGDNMIYYAVVEITSPQDGDSERLVVDISPELTLSGHSLYIPGPASVQHFESLLRNVRSAQLIALTYMCIAKLSPS